MSKGIWLAVGAYAAWGILPVYWKWLKGVPALELLTHRVIWSCLLLTIYILATRQGRALRVAAAKGRVLAVYLAAAALIAVNWLTYIWAVNAGFIVETSLGYFINPLLNVIMGMLFFRERLRPLQWLPILLAAAGVAFLTVSYGRLPWIALTLAFSFALYGLVKKTAPLGSLFGLTLETAILLLPALSFLALVEARGQAAFLHEGALTDLLLVGAGLITTVPLLMFASAAQRIPFSMIGVLQYIAPTLQFLLGVLAYHEPFDRTRLIGFSIVWAALLLFWAEGVLARRRPRVREAAG
jgi:chloramphenicol-sensitive protein RarD